MDRHKEYIKDLVDDSPPREYHPGSLTIPEGNHDTYITNFFCDDRDTPIYQAIFSFTIGLLLSPCAQGIFFLVIFSILYEIVFFIFTKGNPRWWNSLT